jgi:hypothetical protein
MALSDMAKVEAIAAAFYALTGERPNIRRGEGFSEIVPTESQSVKVRALLEGWIAKEPGSVRVNLSGIWWPLVLKRFGLWASGAMGLSFYLGRKS